MNNIKMIKAACKLVICLIFLFQINQLHAQTKKSKLVKGKTVSSEIKPGEKHRFAVELEDQQFAFFKLMQKGVDLIITTFDATGKKIADFDSPNGKNGPELIWIVSNKKGNYEIEVRPLDASQPVGRYDLRIEKIEARGSTPGKQVDQLFTPWDSNTTPGAAVSVVKDGKIIYKKGYGMANLEYNIPITPSTVFHIASISKQFTAFSILLLAKDGKLSLDDDIRKYIPEVPDFGKTITLRHLANHTSGLRDQWNLLGIAGWRLDDVITKEHILKLVSKQKALNFDPGAEYLYCNTGFTLLAEVVARVSGKSFAVFTEERIFKPLNMKNTLFYDDHEKIVKNRAYSYRGSGAGYKKSVLSYSNVGATSLFTTVEDLSLWAINFEEPIVGDRKIINQMKKRGVLNSGRKISYALGQSIGTYKGLNRVGHGGADAGYRTYIGRFTDQKFSVIVFSNDASFGSGTMASRVVDIYLNDEIAAKNKALKVVAKNKDAAAKADKSVTKPVSVDVETLNSYAGQFELQPGFVITITQENGKLFGRATGQPKAALRAESLTKFVVEGVDAKISFHMDRGKKVNLLKLHQGGRIRDARRIKPFDKSAVELSEFAGRFYSEELSTAYIFTVENGKLVAKHSRLSDINMTPIKADLFSGDRWFFRRIEFVRDKNKKIIGCKVSSGRVRNLLFKKIENGKQLP